MLFRSELHEILHRVLICLYVIVKKKLAVLGWQTAKLWKEHCFLLAIGKLLKHFSLKLFLRGLALRNNYCSEQYVAKKLLRGKLDDSPVMN